MAFFKRKPKTAESTPRVVPPALKPVSAPAQAFEAPKPPPVEAPAAPPAKPRRVRDDFPGLGLDCVMTDESGKLVVRYRRADCSIVWKTYEEATVEI